MTIKEFMGDNHLCVTPGPEGDQIQQILFDNGYKWFAGGETTPWYYEWADCTYLHLSGDDISNSKEGAQLSNKEFLRKFGKQSRFKKFIKLMIGE